ncbi:MAG: nucleotidyltransferase [Lachnospiraceae bacterium]|nr:nucleotidyltransferase [Lachnospiraceae bacterium]
MKKPVLVVMAAGMGSRYGGLKQIDPVDQEGHIIIDFSVYDAVRAGFEKVVFIIKKEIEADFRAVIGDRLSRYIEVAYVHQEMQNLPEGFQVPEGRVKPWGTGHAVLSCIGEVDGPMAVINADDYYGRHAFALAYDFLTQDAAEEDTVSQYMMVGYRLDNTLTENGSVARGVCETDENGCLAKITERTCIERHGDGIAFTEDGGETWTELPPDCTVSLNMWGFSADILTRLNERFRTFLEDNLQKNPMKCEYFLPFVVDELLTEKKATVKVMKSPDKWYGVTYREDKPILMAAIQRMKEEGIYPRNLWEDR